MKRGTRVEVRNKFDGSWSTGFAIEEEGTDNMGRPLWRSVRRAADDLVLPERFRPADVRRERDRGRSTWWY